MRNRSIFDEWVKSKPNPREGTNNAFGQEVWADDLGYDGGILEAPPQGGGRELPPYLDGAGPGTYKAPDGVNEITIHNNGSASITQMYVPEFWDGEKWVQGDDPEMYSGEGGLEGFAERKGGGVLEAPRQGSPFNPIRNSGEIEGPMVVEDSLNQRRKPFGY